MFFQINKSKKKYVSDHRKNFKKSSEFSLIMTCQIDIVDMMVNFFGDTVGNNTTMPTIAKRK